MSEEAKAEVRAQALTVIKDFRDSGGVLPEAPSADTIHRMMEFLVAEEMELDGGDQRGNDWAQQLDEKTRQDFSVIIIGGGMADVLAAIRLEEAGITVPNFPSFFLCYRPGTNLAFGGSIIFNIECQVRYIMDGLRSLLTTEHQALECRQEVFDDYHRRFRAQHAQMIWEHKSVKYSFYTNDDGKCTLLWPWKILQLWQWTRTLESKDYRFS